MTELAGEGWLLFGLNVTLAGLALMVAGDGGGLGAFGLFMALFGLLFGCIGQFGVPRETSRQRCLSVRHQRDVSSERVR